VDAVEFLEDAPPHADGVGLVEDEFEAARNGAPFALEDGPGFKGDGGDVVNRGAAGAALGMEVGDFVEHERAGEAEVATRSGEDAMLAVGVPTGDRIFMSSSEASQKALRPLLESLRKPGKS